MPFSPGSLQVIDKWLKDRCPSLKCAACNGTSLEANEIFVCTPKSKPMGALAGRGPNTEFLSLICAKCGYTMFFSVKTMGLTV
jgi:predicted nucleic-acid-binding Zn-ribbon protein